MVVKCPRYAVLEKNVVNHNMADEVVYSSCQRALGEVATTHCLQCSNSERNKRIKLLTMEAMPFCQKDTSLVDCVT